MVELDVSPLSFTSDAEVECTAKSVTVKRDGIRQLRRQHIPTHRNGSLGGICCMSTHRIYR